MIDKNNVCFLLFLLHFHCSGGEPEQLPQYNPYSNHRSSSQLEQQHVYDTATNSFGQNTNRDFMTPSYGQQQFHQYPFPQFPTSFSTTADTPPQLWSGPPIVVADDYSPFSKVNSDQHNVDYNGALLALQRDSKDIPVHDNRRQLQQQHQQQRQQKPSDFNYGNHVIYHSDVARHQINSSPPPPAVAKQRNLVIYNQPEQQPQRPPSPQQLHASNTDLNYLRAVAGNTNNAGYTIAGGRDGNAVDYSEHFQEYLRKHPRRIRPMY